MGAFSISYITAGFVAVLIGYTSAAAIVFQAAMAGGADAAMVSSWLWALGIGMGVSGIGLSLYYKHPIMVAWSTPGAALLVTSLPGISMPDAIGAFLFSSGLIALCGLTGWFDRIMRLIPQSLATAMLAGVLLRFCLKVFPAFVTDMWIVGPMVLVYILGKWRGSRYAIPATFLTGIVMAITSGQLQDFTLSMTMTEPVWIAPTFTGSVLIGIGLPLFVVTMASQNVPGIAVLRAHGYQTPASPLMTWTGLCGVVFAPFGGFAYNLAAITAAICMGKDVDERPERCYLAAVWAGIFYILVGVFGATVVGVFMVFPAALIAAIAGLALLGTIANSLHAALVEEKSREAAILTFVVTASGATFLTIGAPFWGLIVGLWVFHLPKK